MRFLILFGVICAQQVFAASMLERSTSAFYLRSQRSTLMQMGLGSLCSTMALPSSEVPCNPAFLTGSDESLGVANLMLGDDYETMSRNRDLLSEHGKYAFAESLLSEKDAVHFEGSAQFWWRSSTFAVSLEPLRATYYSRVRNQAYPDVAIQALQEQSLQIQWAGFQNENWTFGFGLKAIDRRFVQEEFNLFDALPHLEDFFKVKTQKALFFEPGFSYLIPDEDLKSWKPRLSLLVSQLGYVDHLYDEVPTKPYLDTGISVAPTVLDGQWEWALNYRWISNPDLERKFRLGTQFHAGPILLLAAYDPDEWDFGIRAEIKALSLGYLYKKQNWQDFAGQSVFDDTSYFEVRLIF